MTLRPPAHPSGVRSHNLALVMSALADSGMAEGGVAGGGSSRTAIAARTGLTKASVTSLVDELMACGLVAEDEPTRGTRGRPATTLRVHPAAPAAIGVDLGVNAVTAVRTDLSGLLLAEQRVAAHGRDRTVDTIVEAIAVAWRAAAPGGSLVAGTAIAVPGVVDRDGTVLRAPNLPALSGVNLPALVAERLGLDPADVLADNEANLAALATLASGTAGRNFVHVSGEVGVGAGVVIDGQLFRGAGGLAGEIGHVPVDADGRPCGCGGRGCLEQYAGQEHLATAAERAVAGHSLGIALSALVNVLDVHTVVLGGVYAEVFDELAPAVREELARRVVASEQRELVVQCSAIRLDAGAIGAAAMVVRDALATGRLWRTN
jgi:predicted NBD/HSP70 family sugar kinase